MEPLKRIHMYMHMAMACEEDFTKVATVNVTKVNQLLKSR